MKNTVFLFGALAFTLTSLAHAMSPTNQCGRGNKIVASYICADAETGGSYSLGAFVICSQMKNGKNIGYTSKLDDNVVAYGGGYSFGEVTMTSSTLTISNGQDIDTLNLKTGLAKLQDEKMKCSPSEK